MGSTVVAQLQNFYNQKRQLQQKCSEANLPADTREENMIRDEMRRSVRNYPVAPPGWDHRGVHITAVTSMYRDLAAQTIARDPAMPLLNEERAQNWQTYFDAKDELLTQTTDALKQTGHGVTAVLLEQFEKCKLQFVLPRNPAMQTGYERHLANAAGISNNKG